MLELNKMEEFSIEGDDNILATSDPDLYKLVIDCSGSMEDKEYIVQECLEEYKRRLSNIDENTSISVSKDLFDSHYYNGKYSHVSKLDTSYTADGLTDLYGAIVKSVKATIAELNKRLEEGYVPKCTNIYLTDGIPEGPTDHTFADAFNAVQEAKDAGVVMVFIDFGGRNRDMPKSLGFDSIYTSDNSDKALQEIFEDVTSSSIRQSQQKVINPLDWMGRN